MAIRTRRRMRAALLSLQATLAALGVDDERRQGLSGGG